MSTALKSGSTTTRIGLATNHETIVTIKRGAWDRDTIEVRFETLFANAKDPLVRQIKAQFFFKRRSDVYLEPKHSIVLGCGQD